MRPGYRGKRHDHRNHEYFKADLNVTLADPFGLEKAAENLSQINGRTGSRWTARPSAAAT